MTNTHTDLIKVYLFRKVVCKSCVSQTIKCELGSDEPGGAVHMGASCKGIPADLGPGLSGVTPRPFSREPAISQHREKVIELIRRNMHFNSSSFYFLLNFVISPKL